MLMVKFRENLVVIRAGLNNFARQRYRYIINHLPQVSETVTPYQEADRSKKEQVRDMFDAIAGRYDLMNHSMTMGSDILWRRKAVSMLRSYRPKHILDIATGTGDFAIELLKLNPDRITGVDISEGMLEIGRQKIQNIKGGSIIEMVTGDSEYLLFETDSIDAITVGFGVRNFEHLEKGLGEMLRVLKPGAPAIVLEPGFPQSFPMKQMFSLYFKTILPIIGRLVSKDRRAYAYLPESVQAFPSGTKFVDICKKVGYRKALYKPLTFGACALYLLEK